MAGDTGRAPVTVPERTESRVARKSNRFNNPFADLGALKKALEAEAVKPPPAPPQKPAPRADPERGDDVLFHEAMRGIDRVFADPRGRVVPPPPPDNAEGVPIYDEDAEVCAELASLVDGTGTFDISDSDEFIEGAATGLDRRILQRLRRGDYAVNAHLDLHGMTREVARDAVEQFVLQSRRNRHRCVLIVHGRGLNSKDKIPVLKLLVQNWLERGRIARSVLAFATARPHDGGAGAVYVLLRRTPR